MAGKSKKRDSTVKLSRRERQLLDVVYMLGKASAQEVMESLHDPPGYSAVRKWLSIMEDRGLIGHEKIGKHYVYSPVVPKDKASDSALKHLVNTFFEGSKARAITSLLKGSAEELSEQEKQEIVAMIEKSQVEGR